MLDTFVVCKHWALISRRIPIIKWFFLTSKSFYPEMLWTDIQLSAWNQEEQWFHIYTSWSWACLSVCRASLFKPQRLRRENLVGFLKIKNNKCKATSAVLASLLCRQCWTLKTALKSWILVAVGTMLHFFTSLLKIPALLSIYLTQCNGLYSVPFISNITTARRWRT